jgi:hypothetical protein
LCFATGSDKSYAFSGIIRNESHVISRCPVGSWLGVNNLSHGLLLCSNRVDSHPQLSFYRFPTIDIYLNNFSKAVGEPNYLVLYAVHSLYSSVEDDHAVHEACR